MNEILEHWYLIVAFLASIMVVAKFAARFFGLSRAEQEKKVRKWLVWAVVQAEAELGSQTGQLKLQRVYEMLAQRFPAVAKRITFDTFSAWVDDALILAEKMISENEKVGELVSR